MTASWVDDVLAALAAIDARHAARRGRTVGDAEADPVAMVRVVWTGRVEGDRRFSIIAYSDHHQRVRLDDKQRQDRLDALLAAYPDVNWCTGWDYYIADARLAPTPLPWEDGYVPEDTGFGPAHDIPTTIGAAA